MSGSDDVTNVDTLELVARLTQANSDALQYTNDRLIESAKKDARQMAKAFRTLYDAIDRCKVVDRTLLEAQMLVDSDVFLAGLILNEPST